MSLLLALTAGGPPPPTIRPVKRLTPAGLDQGTATIGGVIRLGILATAIIAPCIVGPRMVAEEPLLRPRITTGYVVTVAPATPTPAYRVTSPPPADPDMLRGRITPATYRPPSVPVWRRSTTLYEPVELAGLIRSAPAPTVVVVGWITAPITLDIPSQMAGRIVAAPFAGDEADPGAGTATSTLIESATRAALIGPVTLSALREVATAATVDIAATSALTEATTTSRLAGPTVTSTLRETL